MTRFTESETGTVVGTQRLTVKVRPVADKDALFKSVRSSLIKAQYLLARTVAKLNKDYTYIPSYVKQQAKVFFKTSSREDLETIKAHIGMIVTGLEADMTIKAGATVGTGNADVHGAVSRYTDPTVDPSRPYHTKTVRLSDDVAYTRGAIRIDKDAIAKPSSRGALVLIHEASHKYAGTVDRVYFEFPDGAPESDFTRDDALINADSYAWFVFRVGNSW